MRRDAKNSGGFENSMTEGFRQRKLTTGRAELEMRARKGGLFGLFFLSSKGAELLRHYKQRLSTIFTSAPGPSERGLYQTICYVLALKLLKHKRAQQDIEEVPCQTTYVPNSSSGLFASGRC